MRKNLAVVFLSLTILIPGVSHAQRDYGQSIRDFGTDVYLLVKYGEFTIADSVPENGSDIRNVGLVFGRDLSEVLAMEFEYNFTVSKDDDYLGTDANASVDTLGLFLVGKTSGDLYFKGRVGYTRATQEFGESVLTSTYSNLEGSKNIYGVAYGVAGGYKFMRGGAIELEYMVYPTRDDVVLDFRSAGGPVVEEDLEMDFVSINYVASFD